MDTSQTWVPPSGRGQEVALVRFSVGGTQILSDALIVVHVCISTMSTLDVKKRLTPETLPVNISLFRASLLIRRLCKYEGQGDNDIKILCYVKP